MKIAVHLQEETNEELLRRRGELAYAVQMAALEALPLAEETNTEIAALQAELERRGIA